MAFLNKFFSQDNDEVSLQVEKIIEEAQRSGATELNLGAIIFIKQNRIFHFTKLPESLRQLTQLQSLEISSHQLTQLPEWLGQLKQLKSLNISHNRLTVLPKSLEHLIHLRSLDISFNRFKQLPESLRQLTQLESLDLTNNLLASLPTWLGQFSQLKWLGLSNNQLTILPESMGYLSQLPSLNLSNNHLTVLPESLVRLTHLEALDLSQNHLTALPESLEHLTQLLSLDLSINKLTTLPESFGNLTKLQKVIFANNQLMVLPESLGNLTKLQLLSLINNQLTDLPATLTQSEHLTYLSLDGNPLNPELAEANKQGLEAVKAYLSAKTEGEIVLNEAKLILVGEGEVGKTSLLAALRGDEWVEKRETTHGIEVDITSMQITDSVTGKEITLNGWDFGGQNIYRHTHQLFFTTPAVYLVVWEPRRGPDQSRVTEWIKMIKHRAYDESRSSDKPRILIVATHGGPKERLDHIDEDAIRDEFGDLICGFYHVDSKPDKNGICYQLDQLKEAIGREAAAIPSVGRKVPISWKKILEAIRKKSEVNPYISYSSFEALCNSQVISNELAATYATILNELGHLIYYRSDDSLKDIVILKPDYLSKAVSFVLEDKATKDAKGLIEHYRLNEIWDDPARLPKERYPKELHPVFLKLMHQFDLSYQVVMPDAEASPTSLMAQLVPNIRPDRWEDDWKLKLDDLERTQVCRILDSETGRTVEAEGLIYRLIVRLHRYSLGRKNYHQSRHWKTGLILDDGYNGRAFIEEIGGDVYITVRAAYPEHFLFHLCSEIQWLVDHFWKGLDAKLFVPCPNNECKGLLEVDEIMDFKTAGMPKVRCSVCTKFHEIDSLMTTMQPKPEWQDAVEVLRNEHKHILKAVDIGFDSLSTQLRVLMSQADEQYEELLRWVSDSAKDGPRLFSFELVNHKFFDPRAWTKEKFRLTLWCEHSKVPLTCINGVNSKKGVYEIELTQEWFRKAAPYLKFVTSTLSLILPVASAGIKLAMADDIYKNIEKQLDFSKEVINASLSGSEKTIDWMERDETSTNPYSKDFRVDEVTVRELHAFLNEKDPGFGDLIRVQNKRREFLWVHEKYRNESEYI